MLKGPMSIFCCFELITHSIFFSCSFSYAKRPVSNSNNSRDINVMVANVTMNSTASANAKRPMPIAIFSM
jgi:hypothetical protein